MRRIKEGHTVIIYWNDGQTLQGIVENTPANVGDLWYIRYESSKEKPVIAINPLCSTFERIERMDMKEPD